MTDPARYVAVDLETTTLDIRYAEPLEIAAIPFDPLDPGVYLLPVETFVPHHPAELVHRADPQALAVNRYYERRLFDLMLTPADTDAAVNTLCELLDGATIVGANPAYDSVVLWAWISKRRPDLAAPPWHHRLYDVSLATRVAQGMNRTPGLGECATIWGLDHDLGRAHTAAGDAFLAADIACSVELSHRGREGIDPTGDAWLSGLR